MSACVNGYRITIQVIPTLVNQSVKLVPYKKYERCPEDPGPIIAAVFLTLIFVVSVVLSIMIIVTIITSFSLKKLLYSKLILNICSVVILDCFLNLTIALVYVSTAPWQFGYPVCYINSFFMLLITLEMILAIALFAMDRLLVLRKFAPYLSMSKNKVTALILLTWLISLSLSLPVVVGFSSMPYKMRYSCSVADSRDDEYLIVRLIIVIIFPVFMLFFILFITCYIFHTEKTKHKKVKGGQTYTYLDQILMTPYYRNEIYPSLCMMALVVAYFIFWLPFAFLITLDPLLSQDWFNKTEPSGQILSGANTSNTNTTNHIPEMINTPVYETVFIWFRFIFDLLVPIIIFTSLKDVRLKCENLIMCCRPATIDATSPKHMNSTFMKTPKSSGFAELKYTSKKTKNDQKNMVSFNTPVLFVTDDGLQIRTVDETYAEVSDHKSLLGFNKNANPEPKFSYESCDIVMPSEEFTDFEGEFDISEDIVPKKHYAQLQDDYEDEKSFTEQVIMGANRALMAQKAEEDENLNNRHIDSEAGGLQSRPESVKEEKKPNKVAEIDEREMMEVEEKFDETIDLNEKPKKAKKHVRFDTENLIQSIPRPRSNESSIGDDEFETVSINSNDSGVWADSELDESELVKISGKKFKPKRVVHNIRNPPPMTLNKKNSGYGRLGKPTPKRKVSKNQVDPNIVSKNHHNAAATKKLPGTPSLHNIKSRYMDHYKNTNATANSVKKIVKPPSLQSY
ncbi:uncharacterized protein LOC125178536 [Hyalella azteca]|uniref:Uncharacterized protein LOC125178536 n=1 Tax=Hyalella azteca TaxID=294128 RepID=A0A979FPB5_HYAAZ|nr:uncharacterized protein LOC125178536 [Hyalella azteca]